MTPAFQGLVMEACAAVIPTSRRLHREFHADAADSTWSFEPASGLFTIATPGRGRSHAVFHLVGNWVEATGAFKWSWDVDGDERPAITKAADHARRVGAHYWLRALTAPSIYVGETEAWHLTMVTAYLSDLPMVAAVPTEAGRSFVALERPVREN